MSALKTLLTLALLVVYIRAQKCPDPNILESDEEEDKKYLTLKIEGETDLDDPESLFKDKNNPDPPGEILSRNDVVVISADFQDDTLLSVTSAGAQFKLVTQVNLTLKAGQTTLHKDVQNVIESPNWKDVIFDIPKPVLGVDRLEMSFFAPKGELKIRDIVFVACVETGWCPWTRWGLCSEYCGGGQQSRNRVCQCPNPDPSRFVCGPGASSGTQVCNVQCCKKPPKWSKWSQWSDCGVTCGKNATTMRTRSCIDDKCPDGTQCRGPTKQTKYCDLPCCPEPPKWNFWGPWSDCGVTCGDATRMRYRSCIDDYRCPDGTACPGPIKQTEDCDLPCCQEVIEFRPPTGVKARHVGPSEDVEPMLVWRGSGKNIFLRNNSLGTDKLMVTFDMPVIIFEIGLETVLSDRVTITFAGNPRPPWVSKVDKDDVPGLRWDKHHFVDKEGVSPVSKLTLEFGYPTGEISVRNLYIIVCPFEEEGDCGPKGAGSCTSCRKCKKPFRCGNAKADCGGDCCCFGRKLTKQERNQCR